jgi:hypothetical protein
VRIRAYASSAAENSLFLAVQEGDVFTEPPSGTDFAELLGYTYFGTSADDIEWDENILGEMGAAQGAIGFVPPLPGGTTYVFWLAETVYRPRSSFIGLDFIVSPEPSTHLLFGLALAILAIRRRTAPRCAQSVQRPSRRLGAPTGHARRSPEELAHGPVRTARTA